MIFVGGFLATFIVVAVVLCLIFGVEVMGWPIPITVPTGGK